MTSARGIIRNLEQPQKTKMRRPLGTNLHFILHINFFSFSF